MALSSARRARSAIDSGALVRLLPDAYVAAEHAESFLARSDAALAWSGEGAALAGASALFAWALLEEAPGRIEIAVPHGRSLQPPPWLTVRQGSYAMPTGTVDGMPCARPAIAIAQAYGDLSAFEQSAVVLGGVARRIVTTRELRQALVTVPRIRQRRRLTCRIESAERGAESWLEETGLRDVFRPSEFDCFVRQHRIAGALGRYRLDMYDPFTRTCIELDGDSWHSGDEQRLRDIVRDADLATMGIQTVRLSRRDVVERPDWCRDVVRMVLAARRRH